MLHYKDMTFCDSDCANSICQRYLSEYQEITAQQIGLPIATCDYSDHCPEYIPLEPVDEVNEEDYL